MKRILPLVCTIFLIGCSDSSQTSTSTPDAKIAEPMNTETPAVSETPIPESVAPSVAQEVTSESQPVDQKTATVAPPPAAVAQKPVAAAKEKPSVKTAAPTTVKTSAINASELFTQKCVSCHGGKGEKVALGKSQIIADFNEQQLKDALYGYQAGTYGKEMKGLMQGQVKSFTPEQIDALAKYISTL